MKEISSAELVLVRKVEAGSPNLTLGEIKRYLAWGRQRNDEFAIEVSLLKECGKEKVDEQSSQG